MDYKKKLGQFYTTNRTHILDGFDLDLENVIEPFAGNGDLIFNKKKTECYDIDPKKDYIIQRDTLLNPPSYKGKFVLTNPPYLARNKSANKTIYDLYKANDLYKCFLVSLMNDPPDGGILIVPLNFFTSIQKSDINLRLKFMKLFHVLRINVFEEKTFDDTTYTICSFQFKLKTEDYNLYFVFYPSMEKLYIKMTNGIIGGELYSLSKNKNFKVSRATKKNKEFVTNIHIKCIDDNVKINLFYSEKESYIDETDNLTGRSYATISIYPSLDEESQKKLILDFNVFLSHYRNMYHSLFLSNYRDYGRKRISFKLVYDIILHLI